MTSITIITIWMIALTFGIINAINDFRIGVQLCDKEAGAHTGSAQYSRWFRDGDGFATASWAGNDKYYDPDCIRVGLEGRDNSAYPQEFRIEDTDIRFCIQLTDHATNSNGNSRYEGAVKCTPWASDNGGWSSWATDSNCYDFDSVRVKVDTRNHQGLVISDVKVGIQFTDGCKSVRKEGNKEYSAFLVGSGTSTWSPWAGDSNWYDPDSAKIYAGFETEIVSSTVIDEVRSIPNAVFKLKNKYSETCLHTSGGTLEVSTTRCSSAARWQMTNLADDNTFKLKWVDYGYNRYLNNPPADPSHLFMVYTESAAYSFKVESADDTFFSFRKDGTINCVLTDTGCSTRCEYDPETGRCDLAGDIKLWSLEDLEENELISVPNNELNTDSTTIDIDDKVTLCGGILVILTVISTCFTVYVWCNNRNNRGYKVVSALSDTDEENVSQPLK